MDNKNFIPPFSILSLAAILVGIRDHRTQFWKGTTLLDLPSFKNQVDGLSAKPLDQCTCHVFCSDTLKNSVHGRWRKGTSW
jgi:hypothetical protein